ncbi:MAG: IS66 family insertion sequence element accessory protein TnpB [Acidobacteriota bacterium]
MLPPAKVRFIHVAMHRVDFRKSHDGLLAECYKMGLDPFAGDVVLFVGRCRRRMKLIFADDSGLWIAFKRFNTRTMKTKFRFLADPQVKNISMGELQMFFEGSAYTIDRRRE